MIPKVALDDFFDDVVIGSSPLMLLQAGILAREGRRVCLVECEPRLGGSWQATELENGERVEIACHVIEFYPGIYEFLEGASGTPFEPLQAQPIRIQRSGLIFPYFNRIMMLMSGVRLIAGLSLARLALVLGWTEDRRNNFLNFQKKFSSYIRYQGPAFFHSSVMQGPKHGYVDFIDRLVKRSKLDGVEFNQFNVSTMTRCRDNRWYLADTEGIVFSAEHVHCTTSTNLRSISAGHFEAQPQKTIRRLSIVAEIPKEAVRTSQTYVAFWADPLVIRISRVDMPKSQPYERYLIEFHSRELALECDLSVEVNNRLRRAKIIDDNGGCNILGKVDCKFTKNIDQLKSGEIDTNLWGYYSMGNLAAGLAAWRNIDRIPPLSNEGLVEKGCTKQNMKVNTIEKIDLHERIL